MQLEGLGVEFGHTQLDLGDIPGEIVELGQKVVEISGPLAVCYAFCAACLVLVFLAGVGIVWRPTRAARGYLFGGYGYVLLLLLLVVFHLSLGDLGLSWLIWLYEGTQPFLNAITVVTTLFVAVELLGGLAQFLTGAVKGDWEMAREAAEGFWAMLVLSIFPVAFIYMTIANEI